ncbi:uncharacterized protein LOC117580330 [Drosophila guanche]|uniref:Uncharacterized protein n=1 Tax=Drosophila guanche TaxID=7266 RepID=A0A3B0JU73_DROGU|nr:uncharacterized protein LOC117580330 [Drosophila guanche]XP_041450057.1 uncharacterized protein LOC111070460 [Drosophila obscura]SPP76271.1 Hypothetical predicted protein [Drosophila guanche]
MLDITWLPTACGSLAPALIPPAHIAILWYFWENYARYVDRHFCTCSCWDTVFKGPYESGVAAYKHMYFNATPNSFKMWILTVFAVIALYECIKRLIALILQSRVRYSMLLLFLLSIFSHYYAWWAYINYYNDDYYNQWNHQLFFTITELFSTVLVMHLASTTNVVTPKKVFCIVGIALLHILASSFDQFFLNVVRGEGYAHQIVRDIGFMVPDLLQLFVPVWLLRQTRRESYSTRPFYRDRKLHRDIVAMFCLVSLLFVLCTVL